MASGFRIEIYSDALVVLATAGFVVPLVRRFGISPVLGYLAAGALLGPLGLGSFKDQVPLLYWLTVVDADNVSGIADLGVVFLLFLIGLELSFERLKTMRRLVFGLGSLQILVSTALIALAAAWAGASSAVAVVVGSCLALSSTAIVLEVLSGARLQSTAGRASFSVLLAQDLAVVPIFLLISVLAAKDSGGVVWGIATALGKASAALIGIVVIGRLLLRPLFRHVATSGTHELFMAAVLFVIVASGLAAGMAGLSMALGAFVAGLLLAETEYRKAIETSVQPFKGLLLGIFFFTVGMGIDVRELAREPLFLAAAVANLILLKIAVLLVLARLYRLPWPSAVEMALPLGPGGEFALVGIGMAGALGLVSAQVQSFVFAVTSFSMALIPALALLARVLSRKMRQAAGADALPAPELRATPSALRGHAMVIGYGRVGQVVGRLLKEHKIAFIAVDSNPAIVTDRRRMGDPVFYGDASDLAFLKSCGLMDAAAVVVTVRSWPRVDAIVASVRELAPGLTIVARARDATHAQHLYKSGVTDAVPETVEASLQLSEAALVGLGVPTGPVIASIHEVRDEVRRALQRAAGSAGEVRAIRRSQR